jgi:hypothetical protein
VDPNAGTPSQLSLTWTQMAAGKGARSAPSGKAGQQPDVECSHQNGPWPAIWMGTSGAPSLGGSNMGWGAGGWLGWDLSRVQTKPSLCWFCPHLLSNLIPLSRPSSHPGPGSRFMTSRHQTQKSCVFCNSFLLGLWAV